MEIAIYAEGGGDSAQQKADLRTGLNGLLSAAKSKAQAKRIRWTLTPCGGRQQTYDAFINALEKNADRVNILLVDSEGPVAGLTGDADADAIETVRHLTNRDQWDLTNTVPARIHLMVQCMEAWIVADPDTLAVFYGQNFARNALPIRQNLEDEAKQDIYDKLAKATGNCLLKKGPYRKIKHASQLLQRVSAEKVAARCPRFALLMQWLEQVIDTA
jgi:hypothetical protein